MQVQIQSSEENTTDGNGLLFIRNIVEQLVDLSRRNPSLNFRPDKSAILLSGKPQELVRGLLPQSSLAIEKLMEASPSTEQLKLLRRLFDRSRLMLEERGVRVLHIAMGLLRWNDEKNNKSYNAPIMLLPVELMRSGESYTLKRLEGAEPELNRPLIELLRRHPSVQFEEPDDAEYSEVATTFLSSLPSGADAGLAHTCHLGLFSYDKLVIVDDIERNAEAILEHPVISALNGNPEPLALLQHGIETPTPPDLDRATADPKRVYVTEADSSQQEAIEAAARGLSLVIQGPPGTGKSQTIVNLIAQAMYDGKPVLFVAEKKVALDVVFDRLAQCGLGDGLLAVQRDADKKSFAAMLGARHAEVASLEHQNGSYQAVASALAELDAYRRQLHEPIDESACTPFELYGRQARHIGAIPPVRIERVQTFDRESRERLGETLERLAAHPSWLRNPDEATWSSLLPDVNDLASIHAAFDDMVEGQRLAVEIRDIVSEAQTIVGSRECTSDDELQALSEWLDLVADSPAVPPHWIDTNPDGATNALQHYVEERRVYEDERSKLLGHYQSQVFDTDIDRLAERFLSEYDRFWKRWFNRSYTTDVNEVLQQRLDAHRKAAYAELRQELDMLRASKSRRQAWAEYTHTLHREFGHLFKGAETTPSELAVAVQWFNRFAKMRGDSVIDPVLAGTLTKQEMDQRTKARALAERLRNACTGISKCAQVLQQLFRDVPDDRAAWEQYLQTKIEAIEEAPRYCQYRKWIADVRQVGCGKLLDMIREDTALAPDHWRAAFELVFDASLIDYVHRTRPQLAAFDRDAHERLRARYAATDESNVSNGGQRVFAQLNDVARTRMGDQKYREAIEIIMREARKARNVMPIRALTMKAFDAIRVLKPCWMMSPLAVSQYLPAGQVFDLVIFDEASQMRPADAIPALSRARQVVVVGDDKQLPPTSFFDNAIAIEVETQPEDNAGNISDYESILDRCGTVLQQRMLRWHYRSRDESLIAFSNDHFYDGRLVTFPSPARRAGLGIRLVKSDSTYTRGGTRQNRGEAAEVARLAFEHARTRPGETLGVIAFSQAQQRAIEDALERAAESDPTAAPFFSDSRPTNERVFVKNLESVQGDERDVIILSIGYGRDEDGKLSYNFGPMNRSGGGRRLNVAVTRAKHEMIVVSSIDDRDLDADKCREGGPSLVRSYLAYARNGGSLRGFAQPTGRGVDSPFEEDVRLVLTKAGHKVHLQVGASGYRIDVAVCHPEREGEYILAIECDGATYHSSPTARDRDRLRDRTLRSFGWRIHRIWSRDWFRRRADEIARLEHAIEQAMEESTRGVKEQPPQLEPAMGTTEPKRDDKTRMMDIAEDVIYRLLDRDGEEYSKQHIIENTSLPDDLVRTALGNLMDDNLVVRIGSGRGTKYKRRRAESLVKRNDT